MGQLIPGRAGSFPAFPCSTSIAPAALLRRWRTVAFATPEALRSQPKGARLSWVATSLSPATLATTRLAEHWAHAHDVTDPLGIPYPDGELWRFGDPSAPSTISGSAAEFCRVGARRLSPADTTPKASGPYGPQALAVLRNYAL
ncbi:maleylpyruvate isomerase N-terminal domain-containing protein [Nonomuraea jabiensis]|uniref:Mycothiol-dependent maleylpyruvate isomerase metal-binding domain-containing protein n=1 Tax=Nonomuraea jabiensis TaxID=882448 RepID=A0A7W9LET5_9ACTN|nr:maleylpyruvate isomerase N-terminal domain-containing protein [Nonomuraea jabiensis]MBB5781211.1 hypothetical protein [Nonomuraea jabiensis]